MDDVISNFIQSKQSGVVMQYKGINSTLHYKCGYTIPTSADVIPRRRSKPSSPVILPKFYSNLDSFLNNVELVYEEPVNSVLINGQDNIFKYKNSLVLSALIPVYNLDTNSNFLVTDILSIFNISIKQLFKDSTTETKIITRQKKTLTTFLNRLLGTQYNLTSQTPDIRYKRITILNTTYINVTVGFSFYTEFECISKILRKILYKYDYTLISIRHNEVDYIDQINNEFNLYIKRKFALISDEILFSQPTKCLKNGGVEYQKARYAYYSSKNLQPPEIIYQESKLKVKRKKKKFFSNKWITM